MTRHDTIRKMRSNLLRRREALRRSLDLSHAQLRRTFERDVGDSVDDAANAECHEINSQLVEVETAEIGRIDVALERLAAGVYGLCEACGRKIPVIRLQAVPYVTLCIQCQRSQESLDGQDEAPPTMRKADALPGGTGSRVP